jgi:nitroreductase
VTPGEELHQAILQRRSVRRYDSDPLDPGTTALVEEVVSRVRPLVPANRFHVLRREVSEQEDLVTTLGAYGRIVSPPQYLVPAMVGESHPLVDLGYRVEQIAVRIAALGLGSCFVGSLGREPYVRERFELPEHARIAAFLIFGRPSVTLGGRTVNAAMRRASGATDKLPAERIFFDGDFDSPVPPPEPLATLIEAARSAPSAADAQPWRFLWSEGRLHLFVKRRNLRYGGGIRSEYRLHDAGACMANVSLALEALDRSGEWILHDPSAPYSIPPHPSSLQPIATLVEKPLS